LVAQVLAEHVLLEYADPITQQATTLFPFNPNGSLHGIAGLKSSNDRIFGQMAHPEVSTFDFTDPQVFEKKEAQKRGHKLSEDLVGQTIIKNIVNYFA
ncbi:MAG: phosphoribosylformylglycinamidine synthase subunit PurQ, partial [Candidatus Paceibacterota bacterium]